MATTSKSPQPSAELVDFLFGKREPVMPSQELVDFLFGQGSLEALVGPLPPRLVSHPSGRRHWTALANGQPHRCPECQEQEGVWVDRGAGR